MRWEDLNTSSTTRKQSYLNTKWVEFRAVLISSRPQATAAHSPWVYNQHVEFTNTSGCGDRQRAFPPPPPRLIRHLNSQFKEEEVLLFGLKDVHQLEDIGMLHPEEMWHRAEGRQRSTKREGEWCQELYGRWRLHRSFSWRNNAKDLLWCSWITGSSRLRAGAAVKGRKMKRRSADCTSLHRELYVQLTIHRRPDLCNQAHPCGHEDDHQQCGGEQVTVTSTATASEGNLPGKVSVFETISQCCSLPVSPAGRYKIFLLPSGSFSSVLKLHWMWKELKSVLEITSTSNQDSPFHLMKGTLSFGTLMHHYHFASPLTGGDSVA